MASITFDDISPAYLSTLELEQLLKLLDEVDVRCTFFVIPYWDVCNSVKQKFSLYLKVASNSGHELALHGFRHLKNEFGGFYPLPLPFIPFRSFKKQKGILEKATSLLEQLVCVRARGFRSPFYLYNNNTLKALADLGFKYDSSETIFKPTHSKFFRIKLSWNYQPHKVHGIIEIPVSGDYTYNLKESNFWDSIKKAVNDLKRATLHGGVFVANIHLNRVDSDLLGKFLRIFVSKTKKMTEFVRLVDVDV